MSNMDSHEIPDIKKDLETTLREQKQLTKSNTATTATTSNSESPPEETAIMTPPARSSRDGAATTTTTATGEEGEGDSDADIEAELKNLDARLAEIDGGSGGPTKKMAALRQGPETVIGAPPPDTPPRTRAAKAKALKPAIAVDLPPQQRDGGHLRQSTEDDPIDPNDEWYRHEMRELERMEHEQFASKITPSPLVEQKMGEVLGELGDKVTVVTQEECERRKREEEEEEREEKKRRKQRRQQQRRAGEEGEERAVAAAEQTEGATAAAAREESSGGEEKAILVREPPAGTRPTGSATSAAAPTSGQAGSSLLSATKGST